MYIQEYILLSMKQEQEERTLVAENEISRGPVPGPRTDPGSHRETKSGTVHPASNGPDASGTRTALVIGAHEDALAAFREVFRDL
jgi:hypothetical protein